jgi:hypothetical protein
MPLPSLISDAEAMGVTTDSTDPRDSWALPCLPNASLPSQLACLPVVSPTA